MLNIGGITPIAQSIPLSSPLTGQKEADKAKQACQGFEAYFTAQLFSTMSKTVAISPKNDWQAQQKDWLWGLISQTVAQQLSEGEGMGLGRQLLASLPPKA